MCSLSGFPSIPLWVTRYPRNTTEDTPNEYFVGLRLICYLLSISKHSSKCYMWSVSCKEFYQHIVDIDLHFFSYFFREHLIHKSLVGRSNILQSKRHHFVIGNHSVWYSLGHWDASGFDYILKNHPWMIASYVMLLPRRADRHEVEGSYPQGRLCLSRWSQCKPSTFHPFSWQRRCWLAICGI